MSTLVLYNTLSRSKEPFRPLHEDYVGLYTCGPTVYNYAHIGNARPIIVFDVLFRLRDEHGTALVLVTHDPALAARCDRRYRLVGGRLEEIA